MLRFLLYTALRLTLASVGVMVGATGLTRAAQSPLPPILYSENGGLYIFQPGCMGLMGGCPTAGRWLADNLYSLPVAQPSPDGAYVAVHHSEVWLIYESACLLNGSDCEGISFEPEFNDVRVVWGPDGSVLAYMDSTGRTLRLRTRGCWDAAAGECFTQATELTDHNVLRPVGWSADGQVMAFLEVQSQNLYKLDMACLDAVTGCLNALQWVERFPILPSGVVLAPDGDGLLYAVDLSGIRYIEELHFRRLSQPGSRRVTFGTGGSMPDWSADGRYVAYTGFPAAGSGDLALFALDMARGLSVRVLAHPGLDIHYPAWWR